jgi:hypothetical protein
MTFSLDVSFSAGVKVVGVGVSASAGFGQSHSVEITTGEDATYEATIGDIGDDDWDAYNYNVGLLVHEVTRPNGSYPVLDYWVTPVGTAYASQAP